MSRRGGGALMTEKKKKVKEDANVSQIARSVGVSDSPPRYERGGSLSSHTELSSHERRKGCQHPAHERIRER